MIQNSFLRIPWVRRFPHLLILVAFVHVTASPVMADETKVGPYDSSKFEPITMIENIPLFRVIDQRSEKKVFFKIRYRTSIPPVEYFRDGLQDSIAQSSAAIQDDGRELQFIIKDFRVEGDSQGQRVELTSRIEVNVSIVANGLASDIGNYKTTYNGTSYRSPNGISVIDIQYVVDSNFHKILEKIFSDKSFINIVKKTP